MFIMFISLVVYNEVVCVCVLSDISACVNAPGNKKASAHMLNRLCWSLGSVGGGMSAVRPGIFASAMYASCLSTQAPLVDKLALYFGNMCWKSYCVRSSFGRERRVWRSVGPALVWMCSSVDLVWVLYLTSKTCLA